jgi:hypothetical protein
MPMYSRSLMHPVDALSSPGEMSPRSLTERSPVKRSVDRLLKIICTLVGYLDCEIDDRARIHIRLCPRRKAYETPYVCSMNRLLHFCGSRYELMPVRKSKTKPNVYAGTDSANVCLLWSLGSAITLAGSELNLCECSQNGYSDFTEHWRMLYISATRIVSEIRIQ